MVLMVLFTALVSVGLTAPADGPFSIVIRPVWFQLDAKSVAESRARALGVDVDVNIGSMHLHFGWSAIPFSRLTTNKQPGLL